MAYRPNVACHPGTIGLHKILKIKLYMIWVCTYCNVLEPSSIRMIMTRPKHSITSTIEGNVIEIIHAGKLEIHTVLINHCATYSVFGPVHCLLFCI